jgi:hypothetical protein
MSEFIIISLICILICHVIDRIHLCHIEDKIDELKEEIKTFKNKEN